MDDLIVGIDFGTTNSEVAAFVDGEVRIVGPDNGILPSCVGLTPDGELLIGKPAKNQQCLHPELTIRSVKRMLGSAKTISLGDREFSPQEIAALIIKKLVSWVEKELAQQVAKVVLTVPAYFADAQRNAVREAGELANLEVLRIVNEPTAASLAYGFGGSADEEKTILVYDLGGGTFDVSIVATSKSVTEVLSSCGDNQLGGDDFDDLLVNHVMKFIADELDAPIDSGDIMAKSRLWWACEAAKIALSDEAEVTLREDAITTKEGVPVNLELTIERREYEEIISPLVQRTMICVNKALSDAGKRARDIDEVLLVGGSTRTPLISSLLEDNLGKKPRRDVHPDLCVALGAGVLASRLQGHEVERVLVDITPYTFGVSHLGIRGGAEYPHCFQPIINKTTSLPVSRVERFSTASPFQTKVEIHIYQGDDPDALKNILVGNFFVEGLQPVPEPNPVDCKMSLDIDGILHVSAIECQTGLTKKVVIDSALTTKSEDQIEEAREKLKKLFDPTADDYERSLPIRGNTVDFSEARNVMEKSRKLLPQMHVEDKEEAIELHAAIEHAIKAEDREALDGLVKELKELLFFIEGA